MPRLLQHNRKDREADIKAKAQTQFRKVAQPPAGNHIVRRRFSACRSQ